MGPCDDVRERCRAVAARARLVRIDREALSALALDPAPPLDPQVHFVDGPRAEVAAYVLALDAVNFGSGWFHELPGLGYEAVARGLRTVWAQDGGWTAQRLRALRAAEVATLLGCDEDHVLMRLYTRALRELGRALGARRAVDLVDAADGSAQRLVAALGAMRMWRDPGFLKRAQIAASDLALAGAARWRDRAALTAFADNLLPHVLRRDGVLQVDARVAAVIDAGRVFPRGRAERELRACAVHACELLAARDGVAAWEVDNALWTRGQAARYADPPPHRCHTVAY